MLTLSRAIPLPEAAAPAVLSGESIVCFAHDWGGDPTSKTHIMRLLARRNRVLWVNSIGMRRPAASGRDLRRMFAKLRRGLRGCLEVEPNLFVTSPLVLPLPGWEPADRLNAALLASSLRRLRRRFDLRDPILWTFMPNIGRLLGRLGESMVIYHCVDEYSAFSGVSREALVLQERDLVRRADLVLTSSETLCAERRPLNSNTRFVSHGVDLEHFAQALDPDLEAAPLLRGLRRPVVGFFGLLADWVDFDLVRAAALARPDWSFAFVGRTATSLEPIRRLPNVHLFGPVPYETLPSWCRGFDVGIIPFRTNELTLRANPLKLREYLAAGLPVVSTPMPEVARYRPHVRLASGAADFVRALEDALADRSADAAWTRVRAIRDEGWDARLAEMEQHIAVTRARPGGGP